MRNPFVVLFLIFATYLVLVASVAHAQDIPRTPQVETVSADMAEYCEGLSVLNVVFFEPGSAELTIEAIDLLDENIVVLRACPETLVVVQGQRAEDEPRSLARDRAEVVLEFYRENGVKNCFAPALDGGANWITPGQKADADEVAGNRVRDRVALSVPFACDSPACEPETVVVRDTVTVPGRETVRELLVTRYVPQQRGASIEFSFGVSVAAGEFTVADADRRLQSQQGNLPICDDGGPLRTQCGTMDAKNLVSVSGHASYLFDIGRGWGAGPSLGAGVAIFEGQPLDERDTRHPFKDSAIFGDAGVAMSKEIGSDWTIGARATYRYAPKYSDLEAEHGLGIGLTLGRRF